MHYARYGGRLFGRGSRSGSVLCCIAAITSPVYSGDVPVQFDSGADYRTHCDKITGRGWTLRMKLTAVQLTALAAFWSALKLDDTKTENAEWHPKFRDTAAAMMKHTGHAAFGGALIHTYQTGVLSSRLRDPARLKPDYVRSTFQTNTPTAAHIVTLFELKKYPLDDDDRAQVSPLIIRPLPASHFVALRVLVPCV
jgi:hypothetical protein